MMKVVLFVPLAEEFDGVIDYLNKKGIKSTLPVQKDDEHMTATLRTASGRNIQLHVYVMDPEGREAMGNIIASARVLSVVADQLPNLMILTGIAGSFAAETVKLGDVVVSISSKYLQPDKLMPFSSTEYELVSDCYSKAPPLTVGKIGLHESKKSGSGGVFRIRRDHVILKGTRILYRNYAAHIGTAPPNDLLSAHDLLAGPPPTPGSKRPSNAEIEEISHKAAKIHFGDILGTEWVVDSKEFKDFVIARNLSEDWDWYVQSDRLKGETEGKRRNRWLTKDPILAVDMETYGFMKAAFSYSQWTGDHSETSRCAALAVRGICDMAEGKEQLQKQWKNAIRRLAVTNAVTVAMDVVCSHYGVVR